MLVAKPGVMPMERLTAEDQLMLWPDEIWPQDIGALAVLDGSSLLDPDGRFRIEDVRDAVAGRLHLVPRFRQLLYVPPRRLGGPLWVDAPAFDLTDHVAVLPLPAPGDEAQLAAHNRAAAAATPGPVTPAVGDVVPHRTAGQTRRAVRADAPRHRRRHGRRRHYCEVPRRDCERGSCLEASNGYRRQCQQRLNSSQDTRRQRRQQLRRRLSSLKHPVTTGRQFLAAWPAMREIIAGRPLPVTSLDRRVGPDRALALIRGKLEPAKEFAHTSDATVNDVLLTVTAGGLRRLLNSRGEPVEHGTADLRTRLVTSRAAC